MTNIEDPTRFKYRIPEDEFLELDLVSEIIPGQLYMGMCPMDILDYTNYDLVISCEEEIRAYALEHYEGLYVHYPMLDEDNFELDDSVLFSIAYVINSYRRRNKKVLVHCTAGLNRSGVVVAVCLWLGGLSMRQSIELMREKRDKYVLCNSVFESYLLNNY